MTTTETLNITVGTDEILVETGVATVNSYVASGTPFYLNGYGGNTYLLYNSTSSRLELWVNGSKKEEWS